GYPVTNISDPNSNYVTFLEVPRMNHEWIHHPNAIQVSQNYTPLIERPSFVYQNTRIHPEASRQANQSPDKKSSGSDTSYSSVNSMTYSASDKLNSGNKKDPLIKEDTDENN
ncbi:GSCOCG00002034001-RA-CDS, partial [Cotesia congregata]